MGQCLRVSCKTSIGPGTSAKVQVVRKETRNDARRVLEGKSRALADPTNPRSYADNHPITGGRIKTSKVDENYKRIIGT